MPQARSPNLDAQLFGAILRRLRLERGWTLRKLAQRMGMSPLHLGVLERGGNLPSLTTLFELADVLNIEAAQLVAEMDQARKAEQALRVARGRKKPKKDEGAATP